MGNIGPIILLPIILLPIILLPKGALSGASSIVMSSYPSKLGKVPP